jgi:hypothetical protein
MPWFDDSPTISDPPPPQQTTLRQGDRLSSYSTQIVDEYGAPLNLTDTHCFLTLRPLNPPVDSMWLDHVELTVENALNGEVSYDWQASQTLFGEVGNYAATIEVVYPSGTTITVPSAQQSVVVSLRSGLAGGFYAVGDNGALIADGEGGFVIAAEVLVDDGGESLLGDGDELLIL